MFRLSAALLLLSLLVVLAPWAAAESHAELRAFYPNGEFDLHVDGAAKEAQILFSQRAAAYLVVPAGDSRMYVILQRQKKVATVPTGVLQHENGDVDLPANVTPEVVGAFRLEGADIVITSRVWRARLTPRPAAIGEHTGAALLAHSPQYGLTSRAYRPNAAALVRLRAVTGARVELLFGTWCPRCQQTLGNALRVEKELGAGGIAFAYYGLAAPPAAWKDPRFVQSQAKALPTALVYAGEQLVGRLPPGDWKQFEVALAGLLAR